MKDNHKLLNHGGDWYSFQEEFGCLPLDFSANVSPLGLPESARDAARRAICESARYPDPFCRALREAIAREYKVPAEWILCGNGAADIIYRIAYAARPRRALLMAPCFAEYERALRRAGAEVDFYSSSCDTRGFSHEIHAQSDTYFHCEYGLAMKNKDSGRSQTRAVEGAFVPHATRQERQGVPEFPDTLLQGSGEAESLLAQGFRITDVSRFLEQIQPDTDMIILGEPNNPTGLCTDRAALSQIANFCEARGIRLVLDECFMDFVEDGEERSWLHKWGILREEGETRYRNVCVIRAFTKFYGMAGLRLGWCAIPDRKFRREVILAGPPWSVSCTAQAAGIAALGDHAYRDLLRAMVGKERLRLVKGLKELGFFVLPGEANFMMFYVSEDLYPGKDKNGSVFLPRSEGGGAPSSLRSCCPPEAGGPGDERTGPADLCELLRPYGIMIRDLRSFYGLGPGWYRTAVRTEEENGRFLAVLSEIFGCSGT